MTIQGLEAKPEYNGRAATVVEPTEKDMASIGGTDRIIVRFEDSRTSFAVRPRNLRLVVPITSTNFDEMVETTYQGFRVGEEVFIQGLLGVPHLTG